MITDELIQRINELARKKKTQGLTPVELDEQKRLYAIYLSSVRQQVTVQLDAAGFKPGKQFEQHCHDGCCEHGHNDKHKHTH